MIVLEVVSGEQITFGLDGRMNAANSGNQLFIGSAPDNPDSRLLAIGGAEERKVIGLLEQWADETQGFIRRESLLESDQSALKGQDLLDRLALEFLVTVKDRHVDQ